MPAILRNDDAEALILDIRTGRAAATQAIPACPGAFLQFPTSVVLPGPTRGHLVFPLDCATEPGSLVTSGGSSEVTATVAGITVRGRFSWSIGGGPAAPAAYHFRRRGRDVPRPAWASQLPGSEELPARPPAILARQQGRLCRQGRDAEHWLLTLTGRLLQQSCRGPLSRGLQYRPPLDSDDLVQRGLQVAGRLLPVYASKDRPPCSWLGMLRLDARRDINRELTGLDWLPVDAVAAMTLAETCGIDLSTDPAAAWDAVVDAAERLRRPLPRIESAQLEAAMRAPVLAAYAQAAASTVLGPDVDDDDPGRVAATVARLVGSDPDAVALAGAGDSAVLARVGEQVLRRLHGSRRPGPAVRDRLWEEFVASGQLFATPAGVERFQDLADLKTLVAIDECLQRAAGVRPVATAG